MATLYKFLNNNLEVIYIGITKHNLKKRLQTHDHLSDDCYSQVEYIDYCEFKSKDDADLAERYLVSKLKPKYNTVYTLKNTSISLNEFDKLNFKRMRYTFPKSHNGMNIVVSFSENYGFSNDDTLTLHFKNISDVFGFNGGFDLIGKDECGIDYSLSDIYDLKLTLTGTWECDSLIEELEHVLYLLKNKNVVDGR